jgi:hypothetical protein
MATATSTLLTTLATQLHAADNSVVSNSSLNAIIDSIRSSATDADYEKTAGATITKVFLDQSEQKGLVQPGDSLLLSELNGNALASSTLPTSINLQSDGNGTTSVSDFSAITVAEQATLQEKSGAAARYTVLGTTEFAPNGTNAYDTTSSTKFTNAMRAISVMTTRKKYTTSTLPSVRFSKVDLKAVPATSTNALLNWNATANQWELVTDPGTSGTPAKLIFIELDPADADYAALSNQSSNPSFGIAIAPPTNNDLLTSLQAVYSASSVDALFDNLQAAEGLMLSALEVCRVLAKDNNESGSTITPEEIGKYNVAMTGGSPLSFNDFRNVNSNLGDVLYQSNTPLTNTIVSTHTYTESQAVAAFADLSRLNVPANILSPSGNLRINSNTTNQDLRTYYLYLTSSANKYSTNVMETVNYHVAQSIAPANITNIDFQELLNGGAWADVAAPASIAAAVGKFQNNWGDQTYHQVAAPGTYTDASKLVDRITVFQPVAQWTAASITKDSFDWAQLADYNFFLDDNIFYQALLLIANLKKAYNETADNYIINNLLPNALTPNTHAGINVWSSLSQRDEVAMRAMVVVAAHNGDANKVSKIDHLIPEVINYAKSKGYLVSAKTNQTDAFASIYGINESFQPATSPNKFQSHTNFSVATAQRVSAAFGMASPANVYLISAAHTDDGAPYDTAGDITLAEGNSIVGTVGYEGIQHISSAAHNSNYVAAAALTIGNTNLQYGSEETARLTKSKNILSFFMHSAENANRVAGTTPFDATRTNAWQRYAKEYPADAIAAVNDYFNNNTTTIVTAHNKDMALLLNFTPYLLKDLSVPKTVYCPFISDWTSTNATNFFQLPTMYDAQGNTVTDNASLIPYLEDPVSNTLSYSFSIRRLANLLYDMLSNPVIETLADIISCYTRAAGSKDLIALAYFAKIDSVKQHASLEEVRQALDFGIAITDVEMMALNYPSETGSYGYAGAALKAIAPHDIQAQVMNQ